jgi:hypothetical protein
MHHPEKCLNAASIVYFIDEALFHDWRLFRTCLKEWADNSLAVLIVDFGLPKNPIAITMFVFIDDLLQRVVKMRDDALSGGDVLVYGFFGREN